ncbi:Ig-like domain-containing protein (plasmid) [Citrobacter cronae]|uniref:Ig-like domain-containing protein n=1 Tax=Citrobacter cronae TaxID=1748967 RepID=UPI00351CE8F1
MASTNIGPSNDTIEILENIKSYKVSGFDLVITTAEGSTTTIKDGLTNLVLGKVKLQDTSGQSISQDQVISALETQSLGLDTVYLADKLKSNESETSSKNTEGESEEEEDFQDVAANSEANNAHENNLKKKIEELETLLKNKEKNKIKDINEDIEKKEIKDKTVNRELSKKLKPSDTEVPNEIPLQATPSSSATTSSSSSSSDIPQPKEIEPLPKSESLLFITGKLDADSDSGKKNDSITNINKPTFIGNATPGSTASLVINGINYPLTINDKGNWALQIPSALPDGKYEVTLNIKDGSGKTATTTTSITIDTELTGLTAELNPTSDSGIQNDAITNNAKPVIMGTSEPGSIVKVTINGMTLTTVADKDGKWFVSPGSNIPDGTYTYEVVAADEAGNTATIKNTLTIDTTAPVTTLVLSSDTDSGTQGDFLTNNTRPVLTGVTEPGAKIILTINGTAHEMTANKDGHWTLAVDPALNDGVYDISLEVTDIAGNSLSQTGKLTVDTQPPTVTSALSSDTDTGASNTDNITNNPKPVLTGCTKPFATVTISIAGNSYSVNADEKGTWSWTVPGDLSLNEGDHSYSLSVTDPAGNTLASPFEGEFTLITTPPAEPSVSLDAASNSGDKNDTITSVAKPTLTGSSDPHTEITLTIDGKTYQTQADENGRWQLTLDTPLTDGSHNVVVSAKDIAGNSSATTGNITLVIDTSTPTVTAGLLESDDTGSDNSDGITSVTTPTFHGTATPNTTVLFTINNVEHRIAVGADGLWSLTLPTPLTDDIYEYTVQVINPAGTSSATTGSVTVDTSIPSSESGLSATSDSGRDATDGITNITRPTLTGKSEPGAMVVITFAGISHTLTADAQGTWNLTLPDSLADNTYIYTVTATDKAGNTSSTEHQFTIDTTAPATTLVLSSDTDSGTQGDFLTNNTRPVLTGVTEPEAKIILTINGIAHEMTANKDGHWTLAVDPALNDGVYDISLEVTDIAGNSLSQTGKLTVDTQPPTVTSALSSDTDTGASNTDNITNNPKPVLTGSTKPFATVTISIAGNSYSVNADEKGTWSWTVPGDLSLNEGDHSYSLSVTDPAGNTLASPFEGEFTLITTPPAEPSVSLDVASNSGNKNDAITSVATPTLTGSSDPHTEITLTIDGKTYQTQADENGRWQLTLDTPLTDGSHNVVVSAKDIAGNSSATTGNITLVIDTSTPTVTAGLLESDDTGSDNRDGITSVTTPTFHGTATPNTTVLFTINNVEHRIAVGADGLWSLTLPTPLTDDTYEYTVQVINPAGTSSATTGSVTVDTSIPSSESGLSATSDSGRDATDGITNVTRPTLTGKSEPGAMVVITFAGISHTLTADAQGTWNLTLPDSLADNTYIYTVTATDKAGNTSSTEHQFTIDTTSAINGGLDFSSIMEGSTGNNTTNLVRPTLSGQAEPNSIVKVEINGNTYTASVSDDGKWSIILPKDATPGINNYTVTSEDVAGNKASFSGNFVYVSSGVVPPKVSAQLESDSDSGTKGDGITNINTPVIMGQATAGTTILVTIAGNSYTTTPAADGSWSIQITHPLSEGLHQYTVTATDDSTGLSASVSNNVFIDTITPDTTVSLTDAADTGIKGDMITKNQRPVFTGKTEPGAEITLDIDGQLLNTTADHQGNWTIQGPTWGLPPNYIANYRITVTDRAGNSTVTNGQVTIDNTAPASSNAELDSSSDTGDKDRYYTNILTPTVTGKIEPGSTLKIKINGTTYNVTDIDAHGNWKFTIPAGTVADNGNYHTVRFEYTATDAAGNSSATKSDAIYICKRKLSITSGISDDTDTDTKGDNLTSNARPTLEGTITGGQPSDNIRGTITINGKTYPLTISNDGKKWSFPVPADAALNPGSHDYSITLTDKFGNTISHSSTVTISSLVGYLSPDDDTGTVGDNLTQSRTPSLIGKATPGSSLRIEFNGATHNIPLNADGTWSFTPPGSPFIDGDYTYKLTEVIGSHTTTFNGSFTVDNTPPAITAGLSSADHTPNDDTVTKNPNPTLQGRTEPNREVIVVINGQRYTTTSDADGNWSVTTNANLQPGQSYDYTVTTSDGAGNTGQLTGSIGDYVLPPTASFGAHQDHLTDGITGRTNVVYYNSNPAVITGRGTPGDTITISRGGSTVATAVIGKDGTWQLTMPEFASNTPQGGYHSYDLKVTDSYGITTTYPVRITLDSVPPVLNGGLSNASDTGITGDGITNQKTPTLSGRTDAGLKVTILLNGETYSVTANSSGNWTFTIPSELRDGKYDYTINTMDKAGNVSTINGSFTIDTSSILLTGGVDVTADPNIADGWSNNRDQTLKGEISPGTSLIITINGVNYTPTISATGEWSLNLPNLVDGQYSYTITGTNVAGATSTITGQFTIDGTPPTTTVALSTATDSGALGDFITNNNTPTLLGKTKPGATVTLVIDGQTYSAVANKNGDWQIELTSPLPNNSHNYTISVTDLAQNTSAVINGTLNIMGDTINGNVTGGLDIDSNTGNLGDTITNIKKPNFSGSAPAGTTVVLTINGKTYRTVADQTGNWKLAITDSLSDGPHNYTISLEDVAGNQSAPITGQVTIDSVCLLQLTGLSSDTDSGTSGDNSTNNTTPTLTGTAEPGATISLIIAGNMYTTTANASGQWSVPVTHPLTDATHSYTVTATDTAGNTKTLTANIVIDTTAPDQLTGGLDSSSETGGSGSNASNQSMPTFSGTTESGATVTLSIGGKTFTAVAGANGKWTITLPEAGKLLDGSYPYTITVQDANGNQSGTVLQGNISIQVTPPSSNAGLHADSDSGIAGDQITSNTQPILTGKTAPGASIVVIFDGVSYPLPVNAQGYWSFQIPSHLTNGNYTYQVLASDNVGNTSSYNGGFTIDTTPPSQPTVDLDVSTDSGTTGDNITNIRTPTFSGTAEANSTITLVINGKSYTAQVKSNGSWSITLPARDALPDNDYNYTVIAKDAAGNISTSASGTITIDNTPPQIPTGGLSTDSDTGTSGDSITSVATPKFNGTAEANTTVILTINSKVYEIPVGIDGNWSFTLPDTLVDDVYNYTVQVKNSVGNLSVPLNGNITIDTSAPTEPTGELHADSDTGTVGDHITSINTPKFSGTAEANATVILTINKKVYEISVNSDGSWSFTLPDALVDDVYNYTLQAKDAAGNLSAVVNGSITIDTSAPTEPTGELHADSDTGTAGDHITSINTPKFIGTAEANATIILKINSKTYQFQSGADGTWAFTIPAEDALSDATYGYTLQTKDAAGNLSAEVNGNVTIDSTAPGIPAGGLDAGSDTGSIGDGITNVTTPEFSGTAEANATIILKINSKTYEFPSAANGTWSFTIPAKDALSDATYGYTLQTKDAAGNLSAEVNGSVTIDSTAPGTPTGGLDADSDTGTVGDGITSTTTPEFSGTAEANATITLKINNKTYSTQSAEDGTWSITVPADDALSDNTYDYTLQAKDAAGNLSTEVSGSITVETAPLVDSTSNNASPSVDNIAALSEITSHTANTDDDHYVL